MAYVVKAGDTLTSIAKAHGVTVDQLVKWNKLVVAGRILDLKAPAPPAPKPTDPPKPPSNPYANGLPKVNSSSPSAVALQKELKRVGYMGKSVKENANYGPQTQNSVAEFHRHNPTFSSVGATRDIQIGPKGWAHLRGMKNGAGRLPGAAPSSPAPSPAPSTNPYSKGLPKRNKTSPSAVALQKELKRVGYMSKSIKENANYGPETSHSVAEFHKHNPAYASAGSTYDGQIGPKGWAHLRKMKAGAGRLPSAATRSAAGGTANTGGGGSGRPSSPVPGRKVTYAYGIKNSRYAAGYHTGDDYAAPTGTPVVAVKAGTIVWANTAGGSYGTWMGLRAGGRDYVYCHLSRIAVGSGKKVKAGQVIGYVGATGNVTGPHLHFEDRPAGGGYGSGRKPKW